VSRELTMPKLSDSMAEAVIVRWLVSPGDAFERGEGLVEVETDKATVVYEAEAAGTLDSILVPEGSSAAIGEPIATLGNGAGSPGSGAAPAREPGAATEPSEAAPEPGAAPSATEPRSDDGSPHERPNATPVARRTAVELGVSLHGLAGSGPGGRITREDVERAAATTGEAAPASGAGKGDVETVELTATQATIARRMVESATTIPTFTVSTDIDLSLVVALRRGAQEDGGDVPSINDFVVMAAARALRELPRFNASYVDGKVECYSRVNVGIAVATDDALLVPVVFDADRRALGEIAVETRRLAEAARRRTLAPDDLHDATFTVSNLGMFGVSSFTAIIDPPQVAILAIGGLRGDHVTLTLTCDHRVVYGADGARFLARLRELLERPLVLTAGGR
jgi:pyruvate dehydrogenase E2 component (dihydrolipoamide acetyltransferase)